MSGVFKGIGKIFNAVIVKPIKAVVGAVKDAAVWAWHQPIIRMAAIAVAAYFTAGAAMAYFGAPAAAGASASAVGGAFDAGASALGDASVAGFGSLSAAAALPASLGGVAAGASGSALLAGGAGLSAASGLAAFSGQAIGAAAQAAGATASDISQSVAISALPTGTSDAVLTQVAQSAGNGINLMTPEAIASPTFGTGTIGADAFSGTQAVGTVADATPGLMGSVENGVSNLWTGAKNIATTVGKDVGKVGSSLFGSGAPAALTPGGVAPAASGGMLGDLGKAALIQGGLQIASALLQKPQPQMQYAGVNAKGQGAGLGIHTINGGFGLATGGGEPAPGGVPDALKPGGGGNPGAMTAGAYSGASLSNAGLAGSNGGAGQPGNLGQTAANAAGVGGLVPQGAVNYMGTPA